MGLRLKRLLHFLTPHLDMICMNTFSSKIGPLLFNFQHIKGHHGLELFFCCPILGCSL